mmetsp:Transcript_23932/g.33555  ORF Transcript_23932/g.33555 Transcript_23932/m.33555 type:complete len:394 (-) Transcript_23932:79-1260(-)
MSTTPASHSGLYAPQNSSIQWMDVNGGYLFEQERLRSDIRTLLTDELLADYIVQAEGWSFPAHKAILQVRSPELANHIQKLQSRIIKLEDICPFEITKLSFQQILNYIYSGEAALEVLKPESLMDILSFANMYSIIALAKLCEDQILRCLHVDWTSSLVLLEKAHKFRVQNVMNWALYYTIKNFSKFDASELVGFPSELQERVQKENECPSLPKPPELSRKSLINKSCVSQLATDLKTLLTSQQFCDLQIEIEGESIPVHKAILAARSPLLRQLIKEQGPKDKLNSLKVSMPMECFKKVMNYIYCGEFESFTQIDCLWILAECKTLFGDSTELFQYCESQSQNNISIDNCVETFAASSKLNIKELKMKSLQFIMAHYDIVGPKLEKYTGKSIL